LAADLLGQCAIGLAALIFTALFVPESRAPHPRRADPFGQLFMLLVLVGLTYAIIEGPSHGWRSQRIIACFVIAFLGLIGLLLLEPVLNEPLLDLRLLRSAPFTGATIVAICAFASMAGFLLLNTVYLQEVRHFSALKAGLYTLRHRGDVADPLAVVRAGSVAVRGPPTVNCS